MTRGTNASDTDGKFMGPGPFDSMLFAKAAFGGAVCCSITHGGATPIDVVKTRMQLGPAKYTSFICAGKSIISAEGSGALFTGVMPTFQGCLVQGWFKFGGVEICNTRFAMGMSEQDARNNRDFITLGGSAVAEFVADVFLCPYEACRIRSVSDPSHANEMLATGQKLVAENDVVNGLYSGFGPMLFKQIPYTMAEFSVQQNELPESWHFSVCNEQKCGTDGVPYVWHRDWRGGPSRDHTSSGRR